MSVSLTVFEFMVLGALVVSAIAPVVLLVLFYRDFKGGKLW